MIEKEDYVEPQCPTCIDKKQSIPIDRILNKLDGYLFKEDYGSSKSLLDYWLNEAETIGDYRGKLTLLNECMGIYRKLGDGEKAIFYAENSLKLLDIEEIKGTISVGTTYLNIATVYKAFSQVEKAIEYYKKAEKIYGSLLDEEDVRRSGLYNNYALALGEIGELEKSEEYFFKALNIVEKNEKCKIECAITYCNLCDLENARKGVDYSKKIKNYLDKAKYYIESVTERNGNYAYVLEKCASAFNEYGNKEYGKMLIKRATEIYERA